MEPENRVGGVHLPLCISSPFLSLVRTAWLEAMV